MSKRPANAHAPYPDDWDDIDPDLYEWSVAFFRTIKKLLKVHIKLHADDQVRSGDIFLFNHFSRFETFIPQYLIFEETGCYSCAIASSEFFEEDTALSRYLSKVGVMPHDHPRLFPLLAAQILRGRKVIVFPEGGMVKDRRVLDHQGQYSIYSRVTGERRKHHTGPAVLAQGLEAFKATVRNAYCAKDYAQLRRWTEQLHMDSLEQLLTAALKPTLLVPANITFYPLRSSDNLLAQAVKWFSKGLSLRQLEELNIEGNILLEDTDMDLRMGQPIDPYRSWHWWNRYLLEPVSSEFKDLDALFGLYRSPKTPRQRLLKHYFRRNAIATRNAYMKQMYDHVTINQSHLASTLVMHCIGNGQRSVGKRCFYTTLYIAIKRLQGNDRINLHRSLLNPDDYGDLLDGNSSRLQNFISAAEQAGLITQDDTRFHFQPKLLDDYNFDSVRMENQIAVYNNEAAPIRAVRETIAQTLAECDRISQQQMAHWRFEDECRALECARRRYSAPRFDDINAREIASADPTPFLLEPDKPNGTGVLLIHGLLANPAELRAYGEHLRDRGHVVLGIRLKGHGSSPHDLNQRTYEDWIASVHKGHDILAAFCERIVIVGFSTGGALGLTIAADGKPKLAAVVAIAVPVKFNNPAFMLVTLLHGSNRMLDWVPNFNGLKPFIENSSEHPDINYRNVPVRSLYELRRLIEHLEDVAARIAVPTLLLQADQDPVVSPKSSAMLHAWLHGDQHQLLYVPAAHHGILMDNTAGTWDIIDRFIGLHGLPAPARPCIAEAYTRPRVKEAS